MSTEYKIERISKERLKDLIPLYKDAFAKTVPLKYFQDKFDTKVFGAEHIGFIAYAGNNEPAAYYGLFPCRVMYNENIVLCATSGDTMTHSAHRGKGLFVELAKRTFQLAKESGIKFAYGFPNQNSLKGSISSGWQYFGDHLRIYTMSVKTIPLAKIVRKLKLKRSVGINEREQFSNSLSQKNRGCVLHDKNFFNYKFFSGNRVAIIGGTKVWFKLDGVMKIGDVERIDNFDVSDFLRKLRSYALLKGITEVQFMVSNDTWLDIELSKELEGANAFPVAHIELNASKVDLTKMKYGMCDLDTF